MTPAQTPDQEATAARLKDELRQASASFRKKTARHQIRSRDAIYCAFSTPHFTVARSEAQRDAAQRLRRFGISEAEVAGRRVLDLGCNNGAMLFQLSNLAPASGLGVEYDPDKVDLAKRIATFARIDGLEFRVGDLDHLEAADLPGPFDIVFCLAIEAHVQRPAHLYDLLGAVTRGNLYFEANSPAATDDVLAELRRVGFTEIRHLGACDDDIRPSNNRRPLFTAIRR